MHIDCHDVPRKLRLDHAKGLVGHQLMTFCTRNNIEITEAPVNDQLAVGLLESLIQTIRNRLHPSKIKNW